MKLILFLHQLPQNVLGLLVIFVTCSGKTGSYFVSKLNLRFGVSLGNFIIFGKTPNQIELRHEKGHQKQSLYLGWLYLLVIGLPSFLGNIYDRIFHRKWNPMKRIFRYYNQPWERWADKLGGIDRRYYI